MALANLNINVTANVNNAVNAMTEVKNSANINMGAAGQSVSKLQDDFSKTSAAINQKSKAINSDMQASSDGIQAAAQVTAESIGEIGTTATASFDALKGFSEGVDQAGEKVKQAFGPEAAAQMNSTTDRIKEFVGTRIMIAAVGVALGAVAATIATVGYAAYKASGFVVGLFTGSTYKSENIDALIAMNDKVKELQSSLLMTAQDAGAMNDALNRLGVNKSDVTSVFEKLESTLNGSTDELDRLGVKYKDANGTLLDHTTIVQNAKTVLDEYTEGWNRNQAATAIGLGSYEQLNNYLRVNQQELEKSKQRLNDYNLAIGPETQKFIEQYQSSMREFKNETELMGQGFKRVFADQVMPAFITWSDAFREGWPSIVNGVRHILAAFTSLGYGLKMVFDIAYDTLEGIFKSLGGGMGAVAAATELAMKGQFGAAKEVLVAGWNDARNQIAGIGDKITADATKNLKAMQLAQGMFNKDTSPYKGAGANRKQGKAWVAKPDEEEEIKVRDDVALWSRAHEKYLEYQKAFESRQAEIVKQGAAEQLQILKESYEWGLVDQQTYLQGRLNSQVKELQDEIEIKKALDARLTAEVSKYKDGSTAKDAVAYHDALKKQTEAQKELIALEGKLKVVRLQGADEIKKSAHDKLKNDTQAWQILAEMNGEYQLSRDLQVELLNLEIQRAGFFSKSKDEIEVLKLKREELEKMREPLTAIAKGFQDVAKKWKDTATQMENIGKAAAEGMQNAFSELFFDAMSGKMKRLGDYVMSFLQSVQKAIAQALAQQATAGLIKGATQLIGSIASAWAGTGSDSTGGGLVDAGGSYTGSSIYGQMASFAVGTPYVPSDMIAQIHKGEAIIPASQNRAGASEMSVVVKIENRSSQEVKGKQGEAKFDGKQYVIGVILEDVQNNGPLRGLMAGVR